MVASLHHDQRRHTVPELIETVVVALGLIKNVHDDIVCVYDNPSGIRDTLNTRHQAVVVTEMLFNMIDNCLQLAVIVG